MRALGSPTSKQTCNHRTRSRLIAGHAIIGDLANLQHRVPVGHGEREWHVLLRRNIIPKKSAFPAKAGTHSSTAPSPDKWIPAFAGNADFLHQFLVWKV